MRRIAVSFAVLVLVGAGYLLLARPKYALLYAVIISSGAWGLAVWVRQPRPGLPVLPVFLLQQMLMYLLPVLFQNPSLAEYSEAVLGWSVLGVVVTLLGGLAGWGLSSRYEDLPGSRFNFSVGRLAESQDTIPILSLILLGAGTIYQALTVNGLFWELLPPGLVEFFPVIRTFSGAALSFGALLGGLMVSAPRHTGYRLVFWVVFAFAYLLLISSVLLSSAMSMVFCLLLGLVVGARRFPWGFLIAITLVTAFFNVSKFTMRERYWEAGGGATTSRPLSSLPAFFGEWAQLSLRQFGMGGPKNAHHLDDGQSLTERINNLQNVAFIVRAYEEQLAPPLFGRTYGVIPSLLIPRFLWPDKPRAHEGQIMLNLHFGRQGSLDETERTYIAWGFLPEAIGNFGLLPGSLLFGLVAGWLCGLVESRTRRFRLFSLEGLLVAGLILQLAVSYEMVASVFVTSTFQLLCTVGLGGVGLYFLIGAERVSQRKKRSRSAPPDSGAPGIHPRPE